MEEVLQEMRSAVAKRILVCPEPNRSYQKGIEDGIRIAMDAILSHVGGKTPAKRTH